jgi:hypothetical protein
MTRGNFEVCVERVDGSAATITPVVIKETATTRLTFHPVIVLNQRDRRRPVRGRLVHQRRGNANAEWEEPERLTRLRADEGVALTLRSEELYLLTLVVRGLYGEFWQRGYSLPAVGELIDLETQAQAAAELDEVDTILEEAGAGFLDDASDRVQELLQAQNLPTLLQTILNRDAADVTQANVATGLRILRDALETWEANRENSDEGFWQRTLSQHSFVFSQLFSLPIVVIQENAFVGGRMLTGQGGAHPDFLMQNRMTEHALLVEIKTPTTPLTYETPYRGQIWGPHREVTGAVSQVMRYGEELAQNWHQLSNTSDVPFRVVQPKLLLVAGSLTQLSESRAKLDGFERYRRSLTTVTIVTYDELFERIRILIRLLEGSTDTL